MVSLAHLWKRLLTRFDGFYVGYFINFNMVGPGHKVIDNFMKKYL